MTDGPVELNVRYAHDLDVDFITNSWLESFRDGYFNSTVPNRVYFHEHHKILEAILPRSQVLVMCNAERPDQILAWMCYELVDNVMVVHYVYVKNLLRKKGLAWRLFDFAQGNVANDVVKNVVVTTHQTYKSKSFIKGRKNQRGHDEAMLPYPRRHPERPIEWVYNPYFLFGAKS